MAHNDEEKFVPASRVQRTANYRNSRGERIGIPPDRIAEDDSDLFDKTIIKGIENVDMGGLSGLGNWLVQSGQVSTREITGADKSWDDSAAQQDFLSDDDGFNQGEILESEYGYESDVDVPSRKRSMKVPDNVVESQLHSLRSLLSDAVHQAQEAENKGNVEAAAILDRHAEKLAIQINKLETRKALR